MEKKGFLVWALFWFWKRGFFCLGGEKLKKIIFFKKVKEIWGRAKPRLKTKKIFNPIKKKEKKNRKRGFFWKKLNI